MNVPPAFDTRALHAAINRQRAERGLSWRQLGQETQLGHHVFLRMRTRGISVDALAVMVTWLADTDIAPYIRHEVHDAK